MNNLMKLYADLLTIYAEQVKKIEAQQSEVEKRNRIECVSYEILNRRMFVYDEYLQNIFYGGFCYLEKNLIMPYLINFIVEFENSSEEIKNEFKKIKIKNQDQEYLDNLLQDKFPFIEFLKGQLTELRSLKNKYDIPVKPKRSNASRQIEKYEKDLKEYFEKVKILDGCFNEVNERINLVTELKNII